MTITDTTTVADIVSAVPSTARVFERHRIDFCCGGKIPLADACRKAGAPLEEVTAALEASARQPDPDTRDWNRAPLADLIDHIVSTYHEPLREELPRLESMAAKVARVHGAKAPHLSRLETIVTELSADLRSHMRKEEGVLFPAIRAMTPGGAPGMPIGAPIAVMEHEHDRAGELLAEMHRLTDGYAVPAWACETVRAYYHGLSELESGMHIHVHLENHVLFPRAQGEG